MVGDDPRGTKMDVSEGWDELVGDDAAPEAPKAPPPPVTRDPDRGAGAATQPMGSPAPPKPETPPPVEPDSDPVEVEDDEVPAPAGAEIAGWMKIAGIGLVALLLLWALWPSDSPTHQEGWVEAGKSGAAVAELDRDDADRRASADAGGAGEQGGGAADRAGGGDDGAAGGGDDGAAGGGDDKEAGAAADETKERDQAGATDGESARAEGQGETGNPAHPEPVEGAEPSKDEEVIEVSDSASKRKSRSGSGGGSDRIDVSGQGGDGTESMTAAELLTEAKKANAKGDGRRAYSLAARSYRKRPKDEALQVMTKGACKAGDKDRAKRALKKLPLKKRGDLRKSCKKQGVRI